MIPRRFRRHSGLNVFIVFTDMLFVLVFILLLQVLAQGLEARSEAVSSLTKQHSMLSDALEKLKAEHPRWGIAVHKPDQHENMQRITFSEAMTFRSGSSSIDEMPRDIDRSLLTFRDRSAFLKELSIYLRKAVPENSTIMILGFPGPGEDLSTAVRRAGAVCSIFYSAARFRNGQLLAGAYPEDIPYGYDYGSPMSRYFQGPRDRRVEVLILSRKLGS